MTLIYNIKQIDDLKKNFNLHLFRHGRLPSHLTLLYGTHLRVWISNKFGYGHDCRTSLPDEHS